MDWTIIISSIGGSAALFGALAWLTRSIIVHYLNKDVESFKSALQLKTIEHQVRFHSLHARRAEVIAELYQRLVVTKALMTTLESSQENTFSKTDIEITNHIFKSCIDVFTFFKKNELYFDNSLCEKIEKFNLRAYLGAGIYAAMAKGWEETIKSKSAEMSDKRREILTEFEGKFAAQCRRIDKEIPELLEELKKRFRDILGVPMAA